MKINYIQIRAPNSHTFKLHAAKPTIHEHFQRKNLHSVNGLICKFSSVTVKIHTFSIFLYTLHLFSCCFFTLSLVCLIVCYLMWIFSQCCLLISSFLAAFLMSVSMLKKVKICSKGFRSIANILEIQPYFEVKTTLRMLQIEQKKSKQRHKM